MSAHVNYRAIIRISYDGSNVPTATLRNSVSSRLEEAGLSKIGTGAYETRSSNILAIQAQLNSIFEDLAAISADPDPPSSLDHIWIYIDKS